MVKILQRYDRYRNINFRYSYYHHTLVQTQLRHQQQHTTKWQSFYMNNNKNINNYYYSTSRSISDSEPSSSVSSSIVLKPNYRINLMFGANTDVGKTIITTGLIRASLLRKQKKNSNSTTATIGTTGAGNNDDDYTDGTIVHYIKPLQCGGLETGGDQGFVEKHVSNLLHNNNNNTTGTTIPRFTAQTLYQWSTPVSPHLACQIEDSPVSTNELLSNLQSTLQQHQQDKDTEKNNNNQHHHHHCTNVVTYIETAGGVLSPSSSSPINHATASSAVTTANTNQRWKWTVHGDLYRQSTILSSYCPSVILIGDGRLGGISCTISAMESILIRGYDLVAILFLEPSSTATTNITTHQEGTNVQAIRDYVSTQQLRSGSGELLFPYPNQSIVSLPPIPTNPTIPLFDWYESPIVTSIFQRMEQFMTHNWEDSMYDLRSTIHTVQNTTTNSTSNPIWIPGSTDSSCRRLFVHQTTNTNTIGSPATIQVIESSSSSSSSSSSDSPNGSSESIPSPFSLSSSTSTDNTTTNSTKNNNNSNSNSNTMGAVLRSKSIIDASASWWTQGGILQQQQLDANNNNNNNNTGMILAMAATASRYGGHVSGTPPVSCMIHNPMLLLSQTLIQQQNNNKKKKNGATHVYYTDDGGTSAVEVAIKMGFKTYQRRMKLSSDEIQKTHWIIAAQESCYHGDTLGAMSVMESYVSTEHPWYQERGFGLSPPTIGFHDGKLSISLPDGMNTDDDVSYTFDSIHDVMDIHVRCISPKLFSLYKEMIEMQWLVYEHRSQQKIGCVILEPILQCAGGMKFVDPLWQAAMFDVAESRSIPVILDESTNGLYRLGVQSCSQILLRDPDITIYSKLLTGGILPLSAVVTNRNVYESCLEDEFLYGNTFVANPLACTSALYALSMYDSYHKKRHQEEHENTGRVKYSSRPYLLFNEERVKQISCLPTVKACFTLGSVLTIKLYTSNDDVDNNNRESTGSDIASRLVQTIFESSNILVGLNQVNHDGDVVYLMVPPFTGRDECERITDVLYKAIQDL